MTELGQTSDPRALVPGDADLVESSVRELRARGNSLTGIGRSLREIEVAGWQGLAATAFQQRFSQEPGRWLRAGHAMEAAARVLEGHARTLRWGQAEAVRAIDLWARGARPDAQDVLARAREQVARLGAEAGAALREQALAAPATRWQDALDLPLANLNGERNGGVNPALPTDLATLQRWLNEARAAGADPRRYAALLQQYWLLKAASEAGIDLAAWDPSAGVPGNQQNIRKVYEYYGRLFLNNPDLQWAGMANMIGPSFAAGFQDLDGMRDFAKKLAEKIDSLPPGVRAGLPPGLTQFAEAGSRLSAAEIGWFENKFLAMQKHIFIDMASQHAAYNGGGTCAIDEMRRAELLDDRARDAWHDISTGDPARVRDGSRNLLYREQMQIIAEQYNQMRQHHGPVGEAVTYGMTVAGSASIPGTRTPGEYDPLSVGGRIDVPGPAPVDARLRTPLPDFNITDQNDRWDYVEHDTLPAYQELLRDHPEQARDLIGSSVEQRIAEQRVERRWPDLAEDLLTDWDIRVGVKADADVHPPR